MDWDQYKRLADTPGVWSRWMLEQTLELLEHPQLRSPDSLAGSLDAKHGHIVLQLEACLDQNPIPQPRDHQGGPSLDMFRLSLGQAQAQCLLEVVQRATELGITTTGTSQRGLGGFVAAWTEYLASINANLISGDDMTQPSAIVLELIDGFNKMDIERIVDCFASDAVYHNIPMEAVTGQAEIRAALQPFLAGATAVQWDLISIAENAHGHVLTERVDKFEIDGRWVSIAVMGVFEVVDNQITAWRDYFDLAQFQNQMAPA